MADSIDWLSYEFLVAESALGALRKSLGKLDVDKRRKTVHRTRVAFRRWFTTWAVLKLDGWQSKSFKNGMGLELKTAHHALGSIRDWDVNVKLAGALSLNPSLIEVLESQRKQARKHCFKKILKPSRLRRTLKEVKRYLERRQVKLGEKAASPRTEAFVHLTEALKEREAVTRNLLDVAKSAEDFHSLRLSIKAWRYLLLEFFGEVAEELEKSQKLLGQLNDLERLRLILLDLEPDGFEEALESIAVSREELLSQWSDQKEKLPFGFRPRNLAESYELDKLS